jgi:hypothetical protein
MKKVYISTTGAQYTFPVIIAGKCKFISLNGTKNDFETESTAIQNAIETSQKFKSGKIVLLSGKPNVIAQAVEKPVKKDAPKEDIPKDAETPTKEYPEVTDLQGAISVLKVEYKIMHQSLRTPDNVMKKAQELGVSFPNLK